MLTKTTNDEPQPLLLSLRAIFQLTKKPEVVVHLRQIFEFEQ